MTQHDLFGPQDATHHARSSDPATSHRAAHMSPGRRGTQRYRLAMVFYRNYPDSYNWDEAAIAAGIGAKSSPWRRLTELVEWGFIEPVGVSETTSGGQATTYAMTPWGFVTMRLADDHE